MLTGPQKAFVSMLITLIGGVAAAIVIQVPDNDTVQLWGGIIAGVVTVVANTFGVYYTTNKVATSGADFEAEAAIYRGD
jgi:hypothetical protein